MTISAERGQHGNRQPCRLPTREGHHFADEGTKVNISISMGLSSLKSVLLNPAMPCPVNTVFLPELPTELS